jgi:hypothetical protein
MCIVMHIANVFKDDSQAVQSHFLQIGALFSALALVGNDPHFLISYRFGYGRGVKYIFRNWFALIAVPAGLLLAYTVAYFYFNSDVPNVNLAGSATNLGDEILGLSIWLMYLTVGWHYCKQVYGCMMVYAFYHSYQLKSWQKNIFKWSAISVGLYNLVYLVNLIDQNSGKNGAETPNFPGVHLSTLTLPQWVPMASLGIVIALALCSVFIIFQVRQKTKAWPPVNFLVPWVALFIWWVPVGRLPEYYFIMVPFFHSIQYLPFAFRLEKENIKNRRLFNINASARIILLIFIGFLSFELIPSYLDTALNTEINKTALFFATSFIVFINIHHFFIDSVVWRFSDSEIKNKLLYSSAPPQ